MSEETIYFVRQVKPKHSTPDVRRYFEIAKFTDGHERPEEVGTVREFMTGRFDSDDPAFTCGRTDEKDNKRILIVKQHIKLEEENNAPPIAMYWVDKDKQIKYSTLEIHEDFKKMLNR